MQETCDKQIGEIVQKERRFSTYRRSGARLNVNDAFGVDPRLVHRDVERERVRIDSVFGRSEFDDVSVEIDSIHRRGAHFAVEKPKRVC